MNITLNIDFPLTFEQIETMKDFIIFMETEIDRAKKKEEDYQLGRFNRNKKDSRVVNMREIEDDIKFTKQNIEEYNQELLELQEKYQHYVDNPQLKDTNSEEVNCDCGSIVTKKGLSKHLKSKKHIDYNMQKEIEAENEL